MMHSPPLAPLGQDRQRVGTQLLEHWPWSPFDFIRTISPAGERQSYLDHLTRPLAPADDLRFLAQDAGGAPLAILAERLPWDSQFFGYNIAKLHGLFPLDGPPQPRHADYRPAVQQLQEAARQRDIKYLFAQVDARDLATIRSLTEAGFGLIETRVYYHLNLGEYRHAERYPVRQATAADVDRLGRTARNEVNIYDRFHADPFIEPAEAAHFMENWVRASILEHFADVTFVPDDPAPTAFITVKYHQNQWAQWGLKLGQPVLAAVGPEFRGWYKKLLSEINYHLISIGAEWTYICTQVTNKPALWVLESLGYHYGRCEYILRCLP